MDAAHLRKYLIEPTLDYLNMGGPAAVELMLGTAAQESRLRYLKQLGGGPALGLWQVEPATHNDIWASYLRYRPELAWKVRVVSGFDLCATPDPEQMVSNLAYACAIARLVYYRRPEPLPKAGDLDGQALYYKRHYNTHLGAATPAGYIAHYRSLVGFA